MMSDALQLAQEVGFRVLTSETFSISVDRYYVAMPSIGDDLKGMIEEYYRRAYKAGADAQLRYANP